MINNIITNRIIPVRCNRPNCSLLCNHNTPLWHRTARLNTPPPRQYVRANGPLTLVSIKKSGSNRLIKMWKRSAGAVKTAVPARLRPSGRKRKSRAIFPRFWKRYRAQRQRDYHVVGQQRWLCIVVRGLQVVGERVRRRPQNATQYDGESSLQENYKRNLFFYALSTNKMKVFFLNDIDLNVHKYFSSVSN
jgi:hypothetical protein